MVLPFPLPIRLHRALALAVALCCTSAAAAQSAAPIPLSGQVTTASDGVPIVRAEVRILNPQDGSVLADRIFTDADGQFNADRDIVVSEEETPVVPNRFAVLPLYPNPLVPSGRQVPLRYTVPQNERVEPEVEVFDVLGRRVDGLLAAGLYFVRLSLADGRVSVPQRLVLASGGRVSFAPEQVTALTADGSALAPTRPVPPRSAADASQLKAFRDAFGTTVTLQVRRAGFESAEQPLDLEGTTTGLAVSLTEAAAPSAAFTVSADPQAAEVVTFNGSGSTGEGSLTYAWTFDTAAGERRGGGEQVSQTFAQGGAVTVTLTVASRFGATASTSQVVTIGDLPAPVAQVPTVIRVLDTAGRLVNEATVEIVGTESRARTNALGEAAFAAFDVGVPRSVRVRADGFAVQTIPVSLPVGTAQGVVEMTLLRRASRRSMSNAELGGMMVASDGAMVDLPVEGLMDASGAMVTGEIEVSITPVDVTDEDELGGFPGAFEGVQPDGTRGLISSFGTVEFVFEKDGQELQLAPGKTATVEIPIYTSGATLGDEIALWSVDEQTGSWVQEGTGTVVENASSPTGLALRAEVSHFSWWNCDRFEDSNPETGLCWENQCSTGVCQRVAVGCWAKGSRNGRRGGPDGDEGPVFEVRAFIPQAGRDLLLPTERDVLLAATAVGSNGELLEGQATVRSDGQGFEVDLFPIGPPVDPVSVSVPSTTEGTEVGVYTFTPQPGESVSVTVERLTGTGGTVTVRGPDNLPLLGDAFTSSSPVADVISTQQTGLHKVIIAGAGTSTFRLTLDRVTQTDFGALPNVQTVNLEGTGSTRIFTFEGTAGERATVAASRIGGVSGIYSVSSPSGIEITRGFIGSGSAAREESVVEFLESGTYALRVSSSGGGGDVSLSILPVEPISAEADFEVVVPNYSIRHYALEARAGDIFHAVTSPTADGEFSSARAEFMDLNNELGERGFLPSLPEGLSSGVFVVPETGTYLVRLPGVFSSSSARGVRLTLSSLAPPTEVDFSPLGGFDDARTLEKPSDLGAYRIRGRSGDGLALSVFGDGDEPVGRDLTYRLNRLGGGSTWKPGGVTSSLRRTSGLDPSGVAEAGVHQLDATDDYLLFVYGETGGYAFEADRAAQQDTYVLDDDGVDCADATSRSLLAALAAAPDGATLDLCNGLYESSLAPITEAADVTVRGRAGSGRPEIVTRSTANATLETEGPGFTAEGLDLRIVGTDSRDGFVGLLRNVAGPTVRDVRVLFTDTGGNRPDSGIRVSGIGSVVEGCTVETGRRSIAVTGTDFIVRDNDVTAPITSSGGFSTASVGGTIVRNTIRVENLNALEVTGGSFTIEDNVIEHTGSSGGNLVLLRDDGNGTAPSVVRGNTVHSDENSNPLVQLVVGNPPSAMVFEQNLVRSTAATGSLALLTSPGRTDGSGSLIVRNNVFDGVRGFDGLRFGNLDLWTDRFSFVNNTVQVSPDARFGSTTAIVETFPAPTSPDLVVIAGNIFVGQAGFQSGDQFVFDSTDRDGSGAALDIDYNLFFDFDGTFQRGSSTTGTNNVTGLDPLLTGLLLELGAGSPAIDASATPAQYADIPGVDFDGTARPQGAGFDIGAHERE